MSFATFASESGSGAPTSTGSSATGLLSSTAVSTLFSQTWSTPTPTQTQENNPPNTSIASSASLYLYTFLATLVLLLSVSGAIILRSLILRRRHRIMVEEAIRNGTWIPPAPGGTGTFGLGRNKVDLSKKPKMWETFVADSEKNSLRAASPSPQTQPQPQFRSVTEWDWDTLRPFSASYVPPAEPLPLVLPSAGVVGFPPRLSYYRRIMRFLRPNLESSAPYPLNQRRMEDANTDASSPIDWTGNPKKLQVAIIVAMPRPPTENTPAAAAASTSAGAACPLDDEPEIPHVEFGVALLDVKGDGDDAAPMSQSEKDAKTRHRASASGSSSTEV